MPRKKRPSRWWWAGTMQGEKWTPHPDSPIFAVEEEAWEWARTAGSQKGPDYAAQSPLVVSEVDMAEVVR